MRVPRFRWRDSRCTGSHPFEAIIEKRPYQPYSLTHSHPNEAVATFFVLAKIKHSNVWLSFVLTTSKQN